MWNLQLLGAVDLRAPGGERVMLGRKSRAALAWLAAQPGRRATRDGLVGLLWDGSPEDAARSALRQWVFQMSRRPAGALLHVAGDFVELDGARCEVDLHRFRELAAGESPQGWVRACGLLAGEFAEGLQATPAFDVWAAAERAAVRQAAAALLRRMVDAAADAGQLDAATRLARTLLNSDPLDEDCWRSLIALHARAGGPAQATAAWQECRAVLRNEAGAEPAVQTRRVYEGAVWSPRTTVHVALGRHAPPGPRGDEAAAAANDHVLRGWHHYFAGTAADNARARSAFEAAAALEPGRVDWQVLAAWTRFTDFNFAWNGSPPASYLAAAAASRVLAKTHPRHAAVQLLLAKLRLWRGDVQEAAGDFVRVVEGPSVAAAWSNAADALMRAGRHADALEHVAVAIELDPANRGIFHGVLGHIHFARRELEQAALAFETSLRRNDACCPSMAGLAAVLAELGRIDEARAVASRAATLGQGLEHASHVLGPLADERLRERWLRAWKRAGVRPSAAGTRAS